MTLHIYYLITKPNVITYSFNNSWYWMDNVVLAVSYGVDPLEDRVL